MPAQDRQQVEIRILCLQEAIRAFGGTGLDDSGIIKAAEAFYEFVFGIEAKDDGSKA